MTVTTFAICTIIILAILIIVLLRPNDEKPIYFSRDYIGKRIDVVKKSNNKETVIKSYDYTPENQELAHACADELLYYLNQDYSEVLNG